MTELVIQGEYTSFKHIKTRKAVVLEIEVAEENFQEVIAKLGMPIGGESKPVAVALLKQSIATSNLSKEQLATKNPPPMTHENVQSEGDKLRVRAVMLCKDPEFYNFMLQSTTTVLYSSVQLREVRDSQIKEDLYTRCNIKSLSELTTNVDAQEKFKELDQKFKNWKWEQNNQENLERY